MIRKRDWQRKSKNGGQKDIEEEKEYTLKELKKLLNENNKHFCHEYVRNGWNGTQAYKKVYNKDSENVSGANANKLLRISKIKQYIQFIKTDYEMLCGISKTTQIKEYKKLAYATMEVFNTDWFTLKEYSELTKDQLACIESTKTKHITTELGSEIEVVEVKLRPKIPALARIDKLMGYEMAEKIQHSGQIKTVMDVDTSKYTEAEKALILQAARKANG